LTGWALKHKSRVGEEEANINEAKWTVSCILGFMLLEAFPAFSSTLPVPKNEVIAARVLHFGRDDCNRLLVLRSVGYSVDLCPTVEEFHSTLQKRTGADAILVTGVPVRERRQVVTLTVNVRTLLWSCSIPLTTMRMRASSILSFPVSRVRKRGCGRSPPR
jgi:hypothetical protein